MSNHQPSFTWDAETGIAHCVLKYKPGIEFYGTAYCCAEDFDMMSEKTGCTIALMRAEIEYYKHLRDNEIKPALAALKHLYSLLEINPNVDKNGYEINLVRRQIHQKELDLTVAQQMLTDEKQKLKTLIEEKEKFYQRIRANRK